ncbi:Ubiquitin carboxyl-terminal hydrolase 17 [Sesamum alatum]|uniref:Ubiquitin carboxyl-terminal hydrolase 17 n=1 Tax=Sesamum alatum TaxID=300844 RepID=A0AAE1XSE5_9LAMI|nr:Ubiquitin carboxyl-terminal hydrolase 17 [Sesamum alatum]
MLVLVGVLLILGLVVRHKWRNGAAKKEEILRLVAVASQEEAGTAKLLAFEEYNSPMQPLEKQYYCAVCRCPTTTRCSRCKAVRYCSGKCQIIHWRQGHKDDCQPAIALHASKESQSVVETSSESQSEMHLNDEGKIHSDPSQELDDFGSSSSSTSCFFSSTEQSETSSDASISEVVESGTSISPDKALSVGIHSGTSQTISDSDDADVPRPFPPVYSVNHPPCSNKIEKMLAPKPDESITSTSSKDKREGEAAVVKEFVLHAIELRNSRSPSSVRTSSDEDWKNQAQPSTSKIETSLSRRASGNHRMSNVELSSECSKSLKMPSMDEYWKNKSQICNGKEARSPTSRSSGNRHELPTKIDSTHAISSDGGVRILSESTGKSLKTSVIFPFKLFMQLYACDDVELHPFGLVNCGNSCYANAVLQCLTFTRPIASYLLQGLHSKTCKNAVDKMQSVCLEEAGVSGSFAEDSTLMGLTFGGYLRSKIQCMKCLGRSEIFDRMMDLTVEIDGNIYTLEAALKQFTTSETLGGDDKYKCSRCKSYEKAKKKLTVLEAPNILTIVLKRFRSGNLEKLNKLVQFPEVLNLSPYMSGMNDKYPVYDLYAVVVHLGIMNAAYSGHYVSYVKDFRGDWFRIDDSRVSRVDLETVLSVEAYILFYARQTPRGASFVRNSSVYFDGKTKRNMEAISSSNGAKKKNLKTKPTSLHQGSDKHSDWMSPNDFTGNHVVDAEGSESHSRHRNPIVDSSSDSSSIFSASDAGSYSTDSTKDSSAEDISGYLFGSSWHHP